MNLVTALLSTVLTFLSLIFYINFKLRKRSKNLKQNQIPCLGGGLTNIIRLINGSTTSFQLERELYEAAVKLNSPVVGVPDFAGQTNLLVTDLNLVKAICVKDNEHFVNRRQFQPKEAQNYLSKMLFFMESEQWRGIRIKLSPTFTTRRLRGMFQIFQQSSERMDKYLKNFINPSMRKSMDLDFTEITSKYALDAIANLTFGIDGKCFDVKLEEKSVFEKMATQFGFKFSIKFVLKLILLVMAPKVAAFFGVDVLDQKSTQYFATVIKDVLKRRRATGERKDDFLQLMMDAQKGLLQADEESNLVMHGVSAESEGSFLASEGEKKVSFDDEYIVANGMLFIMAGFDGVHSTIMFALYNLALEQDVQEKLYQEVTSVLEKNGGQCTYETLMDMPYLDMVISESMRRYSVAPRLERVCNKDYQISGTNIVIEKGSIISIPIVGFQHDSRHFPDPEKFIPERFLQENKAKRNPYCHMPFGHGMRNCIGMRCALVKVKVAIVQLVRSFRFAPCEKTKIPMEFDRSMALKPKGGMWLNLTLREN